MSKHCAPYAQDCPSACCDKNGECPEFSGRSCRYFYKGEGWDSGDHSRGGKQRHPRGGHSNGTAFLSGPPPPPIGFPVQQSGGSFGGRREGRHRKHHRRGGASWGAQQSAGPSVEGRKSWKRRGEGKSRRYRGGQGNQIVTEDDDGFSTTKTTVTKSWNGGESAGWSGKSPRDTEFRQTVVKRSSTSGGSATGGATRSLTTSTSSSGKEEGLPLMKIGLALLSLLGFLGILFWACRRRNNTAMYGSGAYGTQVGYVPGGAVGTVGTVGQVGTVGNVGMMGGHTHTATTGHAHTTGFSGMGVGGVGGAGTYGTTMGRPIM